MAPMRQSADTNRNGGKDHSESMLSLLAGSIRTGRGRHQARPVRRGSSASNVGDEAQRRRVFYPQRAADAPIRLNGRCACGRELRDVTIPGIVGDRWFRSVFTQCDCGEVLLLTAGEPKPA
jgi:hypothetical protein